MPRDREGPFLRKLEEVSRKLDAQNRQEKRDYWIRALAAAGAFLLGLGTFLLGLVAAIPFFFGTG